MTRTQFDRRTLLSVGAVGSVGIVASALGLRAGVAHQGDDHGATPVGGGEAAHPAHIHAGTCEELGDVVFPLNDVAALDANATPAASPAASPTADGAGNVVAESTTEVETSLDDILAAEHAINVHESAENIQNYIACGDLTGPATDGELRVELRELNGSGYTGEAHLVDNGDGTTTVTVTLMTAGAAAGTPAAASGQGDAAAVEVDIQDFAYNPASVTIKAGQSVTWTNQDSAPHTATARDRDVLQSGTLNQGESYTQTFDTAGSYEYFCEFHPNMEGTVIVQ
ncbi:MAG TPA: cupredoxin family copper-binding protein [Thermomicrobiales bacterium]|nr:cupredoxin family copper-binding protein [Thermomicrobiales bacterium]